MTTTKDFAVKFGRHPDMGLEGQQAFPFIYTFVNHNDDPGDPPTLACIGPLVQAGKTITHNVLLDPDYNFKLLWIRYTTYLYSESTASWYANVPTAPGAVQDGMDPDMNWLGDPLLRYIKMTLSFQGSGSTVLYGGLNTQALVSGSGKSRIPVPLDIMQGYDYGALAVRTPYLLPRQGHMVFEITNSSDYDLYVGAAIYGMKIRL
jgi:hypothetical protein